ncbi:Serine/threonine-protein kinase mos [Oryzias melastigma]|uniref:non-specific serine/threonine protein kinase n=1 Tax=Oryzias melastigma TaxID=30732 RepID=A0A834F5Y0_ORYME|nr:proto-oncogene serine/threonine-protein kinase mos [Oryzias melastigma]KAF6722146.1 Serine/threonine-protein kinase mos [Oryzias melastigma]
MPSPIPPTRLLPKGLFPSAAGGACSSPLGPRTARGGAAPRCCSSFILWEQLRPVEAVGSGGFGSVFRAEYLGKTVALKRVKKSSKNRLASRQSFWAELNVAHLHHNNIVRVIAASTSAPGGSEADSSIGTILMEFVGNRNLQQIIYGTSEPLREERCLRYSADIARGLRYLHAHSLVHLDIKPANVLVSSEEVCKIADFGCSVKLDRARETCADHPHVSLVGGTYTHRAPELLKGEAVSPKADIFSFGITLWQLLTREPPYAGERQRVLYAIVAQDLRPSLRDSAVFGSELGGRLRALLGACWSADALRRPSASELLELLQQLL